MKQSLIASALAAGLLLQGCSSRPREFVPSLAAAPASRSAFDSAYAECQQAFVAGKLDASGRSASAGGGAAVGAGTAAAGATTAAALGGYGGLAAASATIVLLPFAVLGGAWGMARMKRAKKEQAIKRVMEGCLAERGYTVAGWTRAGQRPVAAPAAASAAPSGS